MSKKGLHLLKLNVQIEQNGVEKLLDQTPDNNVHTHREALLDSIYTILT